MLQGLRSIKLVKVVQCSKTGVIRSDTIFVTFTSLRFITHVDLGLENSVGAAGMQHVGVRDAQTDKCAARHIIDDLPLMTS